MINFNKVIIHEDFLGVAKEDGVKYQLLVDNYIVDEVTVGEINKEPFGLTNYYITTNGSISLQKVKSLTLDELRDARIKEITLTHWEKWEGFEISVSFGKDFWSKEAITFDVEFEPDLANWNFNYSYNEYYETFHEVWSSVFSELESFNFKRSEKKYNFKPSIYPTLNSLPIEKEIENNLKQFVEIHTKTLEVLRDKYFENSLLTSFIFPEELKISCEQYLSYFARFLQDLGITATSNLKEEAGRVLFSVTPTDNVEALDKIREALAVYLNLPASPIVYENNNDFAAMRLQQQIRNLQHSQQMTETEMRSTQYALRLAQLNIENQDKLITRQNDFIDNQNKIIDKITSKSIMIDSLENKEELEKFCEGFEVGKSEFLIKHFGLHLNPATVLKNIGNKFIGKEGEKKSVLGLDEET